MPTQTQSPIRVSLSPSRAAYFAGEPVTLQLTFLNTRQSEAANDAGIHKTSTARLSPSFKATHKRASNSVSSVAISRPPTSPGTSKVPSPVTPSFPKDEMHKVRRKGVVGVKQKHRSLSVDISSFHDDSFAVASSSVLSPKPMIPRITTINPSHPHARKQSMDFIAVPPSPATPSPSNYAAFSSSLESISESTAISSPMNGLPVGVSNTSHGVLEDGSSKRQSRRASLPSTLQPQSASAPVKQRSLPSARLTPGAELLIYGYAQLQASMSFDKAANTAALRSKLRRAKAFGGGTMDISSLASQATNAATPSSSYKSASSLWSGFTKSQESLETTTEFQVDLPIYDMQPTPLFVDLHLGPGDSKSYSYSVDIPSNLPPTFKGRFCKIEYCLTLGVSRRKSPLDHSSASSFISQVMKVPLRVYCCVDASSIPAVLPYDILWPLTRRLSPNPAGVVKEIPSSSTNASFSDPAKSVNRKRDEFLELKKYAADLCGYLQDQNGSGRADGPEESSPENTDLKGCREAVEILTRISRKVSYSVEREGLRIATLTFAKSAYRLGESVLGVLDMNEARLADGMVLKVMASLETGESLLPSLAMTNASSTANMSTRVHAEYYAVLTSATTRLAFCLDIPSDSSPTFTLYDSSRPEPPVGLEWKVKVTLLVALPLKRATGDSQQKAGARKRRGLIRDGVQREWGYAYTAGDQIAPQERLVPSGSSAAAAPPTAESGWMAYLLPSFLTNASSQNLSDTTGPDGADETNSENDSDSDVPQPRWKGKGKEGVLEPDGLGSETDWGRMDLETVECEVPILVYPGNTAFRPNPVVFEV